MVFNLMGKKANILVGALCGAAVGALLARRVVGRPGNSLSTSLATLWSDHWGLILCVAGWVIFSLYWQAAAKNLKVAERTESSPSRQCHVLLTNVALLIELIPAHIGPRYLPPSVWVPWAGTAVVAAGLFLTIWAR